MTVALQKLDGFESTPDGTVEVSEDIPLLENGTQRVYVTHMRKGVQQTMGPCCVLRFKKLSQCVKSSQN